jgi:serine protease Do
MTPTPWARAWLVAAAISTAVGAVTAASATTALAQNRLNVSARPNYGERNLAPGFTPDPQETVLTSGGNLDVASMSLGPDCRGFATAAPDLNVRLSAPSSFLRIFFEGAGQDATLIINKPDGSWVCNDDAVGRDPMIDFNGAPAGLYNVWVGSYNASDRIRGKLKITELRTVRPGGGAAPPSPPPSSTTAGPGAGGGSLNVSARPNFGERTVAPGFTPDPLTIDVTSGGGIDASRSNAGPACTGWVTAAPDFNLRLSGATSFLRFYVNGVAGNGDTTLIVNTADGRWLCNDDSYGGVNPTVDIPNAPPGLYNVWVGSYRNGTQVRGRLNVTELQSNRP